MSDNQSDTLDFLNRIAGNRSFAEQEQQQRERTAPTVTPGAGSGARPSSLMDSLRSQLGNSYQQASPRDNFNDQLTNFGLSLMTSRNPRFLGAVGEAVGAQRDAARQRNTEMRQLLESESQATYREGQLSAAQAEQRLKEATQRYAQDPTNPANRLAVAQAEQAAAHARYYEKSAAHVGERPPHYQQMTDGQGNTIFFDPRTRQQVAAPAGYQAQSAIPRASSGDPVIMGGQVMRPMSDGTFQPVKKADGTPVTPEEFSTLRRTQRQEEAQTGSATRWDTSYRALQQALATEQLKSNGLISEQQIQATLANWLRANPRPPMPGEQAPAVDTTAAPPASVPTSRINMGARP
jgi:hypothetical protein